MISIYHNNRCSKSRDSLALLTQQNIEIKVIDYLKNPPTEKQIKTLLKKLKMKPLELLRKSENLYKDNYKEINLSDDEWIELMAKNPILIERPIIVNGNKAVIGRPPEKVLEIL
ncbi:MAG: arsenate reductase (glutaredoxin) [Bacteroidetes bacterium]|nr:arsenate reductase (glutaredoxin) [Bacteroidota bacterium]